MTNEQALEEIRDWIKIGVILGLTFAVLINGGVLIIGTGLVFIYQTISNFIYYDILGNEDPLKNLPAQVAQSPPIDNCNYSNDEQLCYQMKRIADALESNGEING